MSRLGFGIRLNLRRKSIIFISIIIFLALGLNTLVLTVISTKSFKEAVFSRAHSIGDSIIADINKVLMLGIPLDYIETLNEKMSQLVSQDDTLLYAFITDKAGKVLYHNDSSKPGVTMRDEISRETLNDTDTVIRSDDSVYDLSFPVKDAEGNGAGVLRIGIKSHVINNQVYSQLLIALAVGLVCFVLLTFAIYFAVSKVITNPIEKLEQVAWKISEGDLSEKIDVKGADEIATLGHEINTMADNLSAMIIKIKDITASISLVMSSISDSSKNLMSVIESQKGAIEKTAVAIDEMDNSISAVAMSSESLSESADNTTSSITEINASIATVAKNAEDFNVSAEEAASSVEEMIATIKEIAASLEALSSSSEETASALQEINASIHNVQETAERSVELAEKVSMESSEKGMVSIKAAVKGMDDIKESVGSLAEVINRLGQRSEEIGKILTVIDEVADQTGLLALNAAILAAQAGEHGKAFAVVADEIKNLAERTSSSTSEIAKLIKSVQNETKSSVQMARQGIDVVEKGMKLVWDVNKALESIYESANVSTEMAHGIRKSTAEEATVIGNVTEAIRNMTEQIDLISRATQEQSKGSRLVLDVTDKTREISHQIVGSTREQLTASSQIKKGSENVSEQAVQIRSAISRQKTQSNDIVTAIDSIQKATNRFLSATTEMENIINALRENSESLSSEIKKFKV